MATKTLWEVENTASNGKEPENPYLHGDKNNVIFQPVGYFSIQHEFNGN